MDYDCCLLALKKLKNPGELYQKFWNSSCLSSTRLHILVTLRVRIRLLAGIPRRVQSINLLLCSTIMSCWIPCTKVMFCHPDTHYSCSTTVRPVFMILGHNTKDIPCYKMSKVTQPWESTRVYVTVAASDVSETVSRDLNNPGSVSGFAYRGYRNLPPFFPFQRKS